MEKGIKSKRKILEVAFKLFAAYSYPDVSYSLLEKATDISRGSMVYYFKNKEGIFRDVVNTFVLDMGCINDIPQDRQRSIWEFYNAVCDKIAKSHEDAQSFDINNLNEASFNLERNALQFMPGFKEHRQKMQLEEFELWKKVMQNSINSGELRPDIDVSVWASAFQSIRMGQSYQGVYLPDIYNAESLRRLYESLYYTIKRV